MPDSQPSLAHPLTHPCMYLVTDLDGRSAHIAVTESGTLLDPDVRRKIWNQAVRMAWSEGWELSSGFPEHDLLSTVGEDGVERFPLTPREGGGAA